MNKKRIIKTVILPDEIDKNYNFPLSEDRVQCRDCNSTLFYIRKIMAVVEENSYIQVSGYKDKNYFNIRECGWKLYCAECGEFDDIYFYYKDNIVCEFEELDYAEREEIDYCLAQYNQKRDYEPRYKNTSVEILRKKLEEYEKQKKNKI